MTRTLIRLMAIACTWWMAGAAAGQAGTAFTYQGRLLDGGAPASGAYNMEFSLWDSLVGGSQKGSTVTHVGVSVADGRFTVELDFGAVAMDGDPRWLEVTIAADTLSPRQPITAAPIASQLRGVYVNDAADFVGVGRTYRIGSEYFGVHSPVGNGLYGGMYLSTDTNSGLPFYGYAAGGSPDMWHYYDGGTDKWHLNNGGNRLTVTGDGNVGIGTGSPLYSLQVDTSNVRAISAITSNSSGSTIGLFAYCNASTTTNTTGVYGASLSTTGRGVRGSASAVSGTNIGVLGQSASVSGYDFYADGAGTDYGTSSSRRWKRNIENIDNPLYKLSKLRGVSFDWDEEHGGHHDVGFIAEEVGAVLPEIVVYENNGIDAHGMDYSKMTPLLVEAVNALRETTEMRIDTLEGENAELRERLATLEQAVLQSLGTKTEERE